ncbi:MAG: hypothetical protein R3B07_35820 [Polyangiaceae bacterium]
MFTGAVPKPCFVQAARVFPFDAYDDLYIACSGSFRGNAALCSLGVQARLHDNDVSLLSCALGGLATDKPEAFRFRQRLEWIEEELAGRDDLSRTAALLVALDLARYKGPSEHAQAHFRHYQAHFIEHLQAAEQKVHDLLQSVRVSSFFRGDFREHARRAETGKSAVFAFPPTYKGGYERLYKFLTDQVEWTDTPPYELWDPAGIEAWVDELEADDVDFCVLSDQRFEGREPASAYFNAARKAVYLYTRSGRASVLRDAHASKPFRYQAVEPSQLTKDTRVELVPATSQQMNFLKDRFLAKGIAHSTGHLNFLVYLDGMLAGGFIYRRSTTDPMRELYILSDFSLSRERRLSKLIAMLATSKDTLRLAEQKYVTRFQSVVTTAFTTKPVSMKYRGIFELQKRGEGFLQYASAPRGPSQEIYREWWRKHGGH